MAELWDERDVHGRKTGNTLVRGERIPKGSYHLVVHVWMRRADGAYLIQRRALHLKGNPGLWAATGGSVLAGEESRAAAVRETEEEIGLVLEPSALQLLTRLIKPPSLTDVWLVQIADCDPASLPLGSEVSAVQWAGKDEIEQMIADGRFHPYTYLHLLP